MAERRTEQMARGAEGVLFRGGELEQRARERRQQQLEIAAHGAVDFRCGAFGAAAGQRHEGQRQLVFFRRLKFFGSGRAGQGEKGQALVQFLH